MSSKLAFLPVVGGILSVALAAPRAPQEKPEEAAVAGAEAWLAVVDQGSYGQSWDDAASLFKKAVTKEQWAAAAKAARKPRKDPDGAWRVSGYFIK